MYTSYQVLVTQPTHHICKKDVRLLRKSNSILQHTLTHGLPKSKDKQDVVMKRALFIALEKKQSLAVSRSASLKKVLLLSFGLLVVFLVAPCSIYASESGFRSAEKFSIHADGRIDGRVVDESTGQPLPGANVVVQGTLLGSVTDLQGRFQILGVAEGEVTLQISFIGFVTRELPITVNTGINTLPDIALAADVILGDEIVVSVQAQGQREAINQQISSETAINVVSAKKIQELPEANAAEAVGRLPGVTLQREGGEGTKVVIRGLSPRYSKVQMEGVSLSSTDAGDRSTDLSMISSYMLEGIEVTKAATANQEADQLGGTVNFRLREAPDQPALNAILQGGYNDLRTQVGDYKAVLSGSKRFFNNRFGLFANVDIDRTNRSENSVFAGYEIRGDTLAIANGTSFQDIARVKNRYGGSLVLDYTLPSTKVKLFSMYNLVDENETQFQEIYNAGARTHRLWVDDSNDELSIMTTAVNLEQLFGGLKISANASYNFSRRDVPDGIQMNIQENNAFPNNFSYTSPTDLTNYDGLVINNETGFGFLHPEEFASVANNDDAATFVEWIYSYNSELNQDQYAADLSAEYAFNVSDAFTLDLEVGGKYKRLTRDFDFNRFEHPMWWTAQDIVRETWAEILSDSPFLDGYLTTNQQFPFQPFLDGSFSSEDFFDGQLSRIIDDKLARQFIELIPETDQGVSQGLQRNFPVSDLGDYDGDEDYYAAYLMPTLRIGRKLTLIPGIRYERNRTEYTGARANGVGQWDDPLVFSRYTATRTNEFVLPMLHARYNVTDWFDIRASYTETLSRPSFNLLIPSWQVINPTTFIWNNPDLEPIESDNYDLSLSFYSNKIGLLSVGGFYKNISNFIFGQNTFVVEDDQLLEAYPDVIRTGATVSGFINNPNDATLYGLEFEWQSNFWFLPGAWSGLVFGINYTYTYSELLYPLTRAVFEVVPPGIPILAGGEDASYKARLIDQPDHALNVVLGFDHKGFSIRSSLRLKSNVFTAANFFPELRQETEPLTLVDLSISQKLPAEGLNVFLNVANINEGIDTNTNRGTGWISSRQFFGLTGQMGARYRF